MNAYSFFSIILIFHAEFHCAPVTRVCPPIQLLFGRVRYRQRGRIARFICTSGYTLAGDRYIVCSKGEWDNTLPKCVRGTCPKANPPANGLIYPSHGGGVLNFYCNSNFQIRGHNLTFCNGTHWDNPTPSCLPTKKAPSLSCDFEKPDLCGWNHDLNHDFDWKRLNFGTPSGAIGTGPSHDHTKGFGADGYYMYIESSARNPQDTARLLSPFYDKSTPNETICFEFFYHMYGKTTGDLRVYLKKFNSSWDFNPAKALFSQSGNQGNHWFRGFTRIGVVDDDFQIIIEGVRGHGYVSDTAVDDVRVIRNCTPEDEVYQEPITTTEQTSNAPDVESCDNRCNTTDSSLANLLITCDCTDDCFEKNRCCPDYFDLCVLGSTMEDITNADTTTLPPVRLTTKFNSQTTTTIATTPKVEITQRMQATEMIQTTQRMQAVQTTLMESDMDEVPEEGMNPEYAEKEMDIIQEYDKEIAIQQKITVLEASSNTKTVVFGVGVVFGILFAAIGSAFIARRFQLLNCRKLRRLQQSSNGDSQSDVRFLTGEEILDLNLPHGYGNL